MDVKSSGLFSELLLHNTEPCLIMNHLSLHIFRVLCFMGVSIVSTGKLLAIKNRDPTYKRMPSLTFFFLPAVCSTRGAWIPYSVILSVLFPSLYPNHAICKSPLTYPLEEVFGIRVRVFYLWSPTPVPGYLHNARAVLSIVTDKVVVLCRLSVLLYLRKLREQGAALCPQRA